MHPEELAWRLQRERRSWCTSGFTDIVWGKHKLLRSTTSLPSHSVSRLHSSGVKIFNTVAGRRTQRSCNREESRKFLWPKCIRVIHRELNYSHSKQNIIWTKLEYIKNIWLDGKFLCCIYFTTIKNNFFKKKKFWNLGILFFYTGKH